MKTRLWKVTGTTVAMLVIMTCYAFASEGPGGMPAKEIVPVAELDEAGVSTVYEEEFDGIVDGFRTDETQVAEQAEAVAEEQAAPAPEPAPAPAQTQSYSQDDLEVLAHVLCGEAHTYPDEEQRYVGSVVLNRVKHRAYPNTIRGVVFQKGQYACTWDGNYYRQPTEANYRNAKWLLENGSILPANVVYQSKARQGSGTYVSTKYHKYCYY